MRTSEPFRCRLLSMIPLLLLLSGCGRQDEKAVREVFVCTPATPLLLTPRSGFKPIRELLNGERIDVLFEKDNWLKVRTEKGEEGWVAGEDTAGLDVLERARKLAAESAAEQMQFEAVLGSDANLRLEPDRNAPFPLRLKKAQAVSVLGRSHGASPEVEGGHAPTQFLKVRTAEGDCGWVAVWLVQPVIPPPLEDYQEERKFAACVEMNRIRGGIPQYVYADLSVDADPKADFDRIRVFTWNAKAESYGTAYVERNLRGLLPITSETQDDGSVRVKVRHFDRSGQEHETLYLYKPPYFRKIRS
ncbi:MAG: SH3 domain-containing protein [Acidobacteria bacterium]|nr:SH3 domain-containing protein [Acidobacteriota bacterium]